MKPQAYCVKCKAKKPMADAVESVLKNGRKAIRGKCPACGTGMFKILGASKGESSKPASAAATKTETAVKSGLPFHFLSGLSAAN
jgi:hypothetical protein